MFLPVALILIAGLASDDFSTREACQEALSLCPELAGPLLWRRYADPEVEHRLQAVRQNCDPPDWLLGTWKARSEDSIAFTIVLEPHGQGRFWYTGTPAYTNPFTWQYTGNAIILDCRNGGLEVYRVKPGKRWGTAAQPVEVPYWWTKGRRVLATRMVRVY
jgi:hypothetical protein